ncbi:MAG: hypothetical protein H6Q89_4201 [Myxococcaceae bacterium]|nr:hypothetical protein [Myxococcaceae bacterium]
MTGKIDRLPNAARPRVERTQVETPTRTAAVSRVAPGVKNAFSNGTPSAIGSGGEGQHLARTAGPDALWGKSPERGPNMDPHQFDKLTPAQRQEKLTELRAHRDELHVKILERVVELDKQWQSAPTATKEEALKHYAETSEALDPQTAQELRGMLRQAEVAQRRIDRLRTSRDGMPPARHATAETRARRAELNKELRAARKEHKEAVKEATAVVDEKGLKIDRLAVTEQVIDPSAPKASEGTSLLGMVKNFFKFTWLSDFLFSTIIDFQDRSSEKYVHEAARQREAADTAAHLQKIDHREAIIKLANAAELAKR